MFLMYSSAGVPICTSDKRGWGSARGIGAGESTIKAGAKQTRKLRPYERSRCAEHGVSVNTTLGKECARPTGGRHGRTTNALAQRFNGANLRATLEVG